MAQLRSGLITQFDVLASELGSLAFRERICSTQDVVKQREGRFNLEVMGSAAAASRLLVELPCRASDKVSVAGLQRLPTR